MSFTEAITSAFQNFANFSGRARRSEYWYFVVFNSLVSGILSFLQTRGIDFAGTLAGIFSLAVFIPSMSLAWRRLHDIGKSGGWFFIGLIPVIGWIFLIFWLCKDSEPGPNRFGECPK